MNKVQRWEIIGVFLLLVLVQPFTSGLNGPTIGDL
jgi:hypothetical protein